MKNKVIDIAISKLNIKKYDAYILPLTNQHLYEFTDDIDNYVSMLTDFTGDTATLIICKKCIYLLVDGRFYIQARNEVSDKRVKIIDIDTNFTIYDFIATKLKRNDVIAINPKLHSINEVKKMESFVKKMNLKLVFDANFMTYDFNKLKSGLFRLSCAPLFYLDKNFVSKDSKVKIRNVIKSISSEYDVKEKDVVYVTSNLEEIAYITNLRYRFCDINDHNVLFNSFLILSNKNRTLYISDYLEESAYKYIKKSNINIARYDEFYDDLRHIKAKHIYVDPSINNYYIYKKVSSPILIKSPLTKVMSQKDKTEINCLLKTNLIDGVSLTKTIFLLKKNYIYNNKTINYNEYEIKKIVDDYRRVFGKSLYLCPSFKTIVAYKENSAICHYNPTKLKSKVVKSNSVLLIDSGGNYYTGSTDVTRTISLYKDIKRIPRDLKKNYSIVLNGMLSLARQKFPYGISYVELDIIARKNIYNEYLDYNHGTGHGIGYISNIHEGPNRISRVVNENYKDNVVLEHQLVSDEPGLYFENKYGIRIENDLLSYKVKENSYGKFLGFKTLTLCPFEMDLIDVKYIEKENIDYLNQYNKLIYKKLSSKLTIEERTWLKDMTRKV